MCDLKQQVVMCNTYGISSFLFMFLANNIGHLDMKRLILCLACHMEKNVCFIA